MSVCLFKTPTSRGSTSISRKELLQFSLSRHLSAIFVSRNKIASGECLPSGSLAAGLKLVGTVDYTSLAAATGAGSMVWDDHNMRGFHVHRFANQFAANRETDGDLGLVGHSIWRGVRCCW